MKLDTLFRDEKYHDETMRDYLLRNIEDAIMEVGNFWGMAVFCSASIGYGDVHCPIDQSKVFLYVQTTRRPPLYITDSGLVLTIATKTHLTGNTIWNGDDMYYKEVATEYSNFQKVDSVQNLPRVLQLNDIDDENFEHLVCEIVDNAISYHETTERKTMM